MCKPKCVDVNFDLRHIGFGLYSNLTCSRVNVDVYCGTDIDLFICEVKKCI